MGGYGSREGVNLMARIDVSKQKGEKSGLVGTHSTTLVLRR